MSSVSVEFCGLYVATDLEETRLDEKVSPPVYRRLPSPHPKSSNLLGFTTKLQILGCQSLVGVFCGCASVSKDCLVTEKGHKRHYGVIWQ